MSSRQVGAKGPSAEKKQSGAVKMYLVAYNVVSMGFWAVTLAKIAMHFAAGRKQDTLFDAIHTPLFVGQSLAVLEIFHSLTGLVSSGFMSALIQVSSRLLLVWGVTALSPESRVGWGFTLMTLSWCLVEIPRYLFYAINTLGEERIPGWLLWLRYSLFAILYPSGITGEVLCIWTGLPAFARMTQLNLLMPNALNFSFNYYYFLCACLASYVPGSYTMYSHMLGLRKKKLAPQQPASAGKRTN